MAGNCFFDLPPEIRNEIYFEYLDTYAGGLVTPRISKAKLLFEIGRDHCADASSDALFDYVEEGQHAQECSTAPGLLLASKQNYQEAVPIFLHAQRVYVADLTTFSAWLSGKPTSHWQAIRHIILGQSIADVHVMRGDCLTTFHNKHQAKAVVKLASTLPSLVTLGVETAAVMSYKFRLPWLRQGFRSLQKISMTRVPGAAVVNLASRRAGNSECTQVHSPNMDSQLPERIYIHPNPSTYTSTASISLAKSPQLRLVMLSCWRYTSSAMSSAIHTRGGMRGGGRGGFRGGVRGGLSSRIPWTNNIITHQSLQDPNTGSWSEVTVFASPRDPIVRFNGWSPEKLALYEGHTKLYGERQYAQNFPIRPLRLGFLHLPAELRNRICREVLPFGSIELAPLFIHTPANHKGNNGKARVLHMRKYKREIVPRLRLLRTNKQVHKEASSIFYGENEFRFTNRYGFDTFFFFTRTIGELNTSLLRKVTEGFQQSRRRGDDRVARPSNTARQNFEIVMNYKMGMHEEGRGAWEFNAPCTIIREEGGLQEYRIVIAEEHDVEDGFKLAKAGGLLGFMLREKRRKDGHNKLANIKAQPVLLRAEDDQRVYQEREDLVTGIAMRLEELGLNVVRTTYDADGRYATAEELAEAESEGEDRDGVEESDGT
ncbi:hypothetical protein LTR27_009731 [Elasticomyces elasticus]|nr:hypothetical protein LTR27_009731 [Elasticomyces elasticus]